MADIELVIKIPEALYNNIQKGCGIYPYRLVYNAIVNGTLLPKGHGRLIDADALEYKQTHHGTYILPFELVDRATLHRAPTIVEADKESTDDKG